MKIKFLKWIFILCFLTIPVLVLTADPPGPPNPGGDPSGNGGDPVGAPIDEGLFILLAQGIMYGGWRYYQFKKKNTSETFTVPEDE